MESAQTINVTKVRDDLFYYQNWKITQSCNGTWTAMRIRPTEYFRATSLRAAVLSIDRRINPFYRTLKGKLCEATNLQILSKLLD